LNTEESEQSKFAERFQSALETWRFEVESYWTRTSYFAVFETAALGGQWLIFKDYWYTSLALSIAGMSLTVLWFTNNSRMHEYVDQWWRRAGEIEAHFGIPEGRTLIHDFELRKTITHRIPYHAIDRYLVPGIFFAGWSWMLGWGVFRLVLAVCGCHNHFATLVEQGR